MNTTGLKTKDAVGAMPRRTLESIVRSFNDLKVYRVTDLLGKDCGSLICNADITLIQKCIINLRELEGKVTLDRLISEINDRGFFIQLHTTQELSLMQVSL